MAESFGSWLANAILQHDREFGANLAVPWMGSRYCQLIQASFDLVADFWHSPSQSLCLFDAVRLIPDT